jgi:hypothetical protein
MLACTKLTERAVNYIINVTAVRRHQSDRGCALAGHCARVAPHRTMAR